MTIQEVSDRSGISAAVISKLERNQNVAELNTLHRLGRVFGLTATDLVGLAERRSSQVAEEASHSSGGFHFREVSYGGVKTLYGHAEGGSSVSRPEVHRDDYELCWVLSGHMRLRLPDEVHDLTVGKALQFDAVLPHTYEALDDTDFIILHLRKTKRF